jgi:hypothetical protein
MGFAKKLARKKQKAFNKTASGIKKTATKADRSYRTSMVEQLRRDNHLRRIVSEDILCIFLVSAHRIFGFGKDRLELLYKKTLNQIDCLRKRYVTIYDLEKIIYDEADFHLIEPEVDRHDTDRKLIQDENNRMSVCFLVALMDGWGYKGKRMKRLYEESQRIGVGLRDGEIKIDEVWNELERTKFKWVA